MKRLDNKVAIVTGAGSRGPGLGNGKATAILFAREGARVLCVDLAKDRADETVGLILAEGGEAEAFAADVTVAAQCRAMVEAAVGRWGGLDVLHNNVGIESRHGLMTTTEEEWDRVMTVDLKSMLLTSQAAVPALQTRGGGSIICVSSVAGLRGYGRTAYAAAKAGVIGFVKSIAVQLGPKGIRVNAIAPGTVWTPMVEELGAEARERRRRAAPLGTEGTGWDVGWGAVYLASDESRWVTGHVLVIDAGLTATTSAGTGEQDAVRPPRDGARPPTVTPHASVLGHGVAHALTQGPPGRSCPGLHSPGRSHRRQARVRAAGGRGRHARVDHEVLAPRHPEGEGRRVAARAGARGTPAAGLPRRRDHLGSVPSALPGGAATA